MAQTTRLFQVQLLWNARKFDTAALVWGDLAQANRIAEGVWAQFTPCRTCGMCDALDQPTCLDRYDSDTNHIQADGTYQDGRAVHGGGASLLVTVVHVTFPQQLKLNELRSALRARGAPTGGSKEALEVRLREMMDLTPLPGARQLNGACAPQDG